MKNKKLFFKVLSLLFLFSIPTFLTGCSLSGKPDGGVYKSDDGGATFKQISFIDEKNSIGRENILDVEIDPDQENVVYIGTERAGIFRTTNGGESWARDINNFTEVRAIKRIPGSQKMYIAVKKQGRGKVLKTENGGESWTEVYTEKVEGSAIGAIAFDHNNPEVLYIGTSNGGIFKTEDGGITWKTLLWAKSGVRTIVVDKINPSVVYFGTIKSGALITKNKGKDFSEIKESGQILNIVVHPRLSGTVYLSNSEGLLRSDDYGENWEVLNTLVKPEEIFSRGLAVNPNKNDEIFYTSGKTFYKSTNNGETWQTVQFDINRLINEIEIDSRNPNAIYVGTTAGSSSFKLFPN